MNSSGQNQPHPPRKITIPPKKQNHEKTPVENRPDLIAACLRNLAYAPASQRPAGSKNIEQRQNRHQNPFRRPDFDGIEASRAVKVVISGQGVGHPHRSRRQPDRPGGGPAVRGKLEATLDQKVNNIQNGNVNSTSRPTGKSARSTLRAPRRSSARRRSKAGKFSIEASSAAKIKAAVEAVSCTIETSSASKVEASIETEAVRSTHRAHRKSSSKVPPGRSGPT